MTKHPETEAISDGVTRPILGPSDSSDTAADLIGMESGDDSDRQGTGERMGAGPEDVEEAADIAFDRVVRAREAGLGGGLDQAEEAQLGITDEEIERIAAVGRGE